MKFPKTSGKKKRNAVIKHIIYFVLLALTFSLFWARDNYGNIGVEEILYTLSAPLTGTESGLIKSYLQKALLPSVGIYVLFLLYSFFPFDKKIYFEVKNRDTTERVSIFPIRFSGFWAILLICGWSLGLFYAADQSFSVIDFMKNRLQKSAFIEEEYVDPGETEITFPENKRNLICIYIESGESSFQDVENGGLFQENYIPELTALARENVSFSQSELIEGACVAPACGWTIAGLVAQTCGLPLKVENSASDNTTVSTDSFLPGAVALGDILEEAGYHNYFMAGSDFDFGGRTSYFSQHGNYTIWDYDWAVREGVIASDYKVWWGFEDEKLFAFAKEKLLELSSQDEPFNFSLLTVDTHMPSGYVCELCPDTYSQQYANVIACASAQISEFVAWIQDQDFYENSTIVISGDHASMNSSLFGGTIDTNDAYNTQRKVYNVFVNSAVEPINEKNRKFYTLDMYPTILASLGAEISGNRLGLGTNLFSDEETLAEKYGYETVNTELKKYSSYYVSEILLPQAE